MTNLVLFEEAETLALQRLSALPVGATLDGVAHRRHDCLALRLRKQQNLFREKKLVSRSLEATKVHRRSWAA